MTKWKCRPRLFQHLHDVKAFKTIASTFLPLHSYNISLTFIAYHYWHKNLTNHTWVIEKDQKLIWNKCFEKGQLREKKGSTAMQKKYFRKYFLSSRSHETRNFLSITVVGVCKIKKDYILTWPLFYGCCFECRRKKILNSTPGRSGLRKLKTLKAKLVSYNGVGKDAITTRAFTDFFISKILLDS